MDSKITELHLVIVYLGKELSNQMIIDSAEILSVKLKRF